MKTKNFIPTLLALIIRVMVSGQTQETQSQYRILNALGGKVPSSPSTTLAKKQSLKDKGDAVLNDKSANPPSARKVYPTLITEETSTATNIDNNTFNYYNNPSCYASRVYANELLKQADELLAIAETLRKQSKEKGNAESTGLLSSADNLQKQAELKQIQASEISGKLSIELFSQNELVFKSLLGKVKREVVCEMAIELDNDAGHFVKTAKNLREESYAVSSTAAKLGMMSNAEEKEGQALAKQEEALAMLKNAIAAGKYFESHDLAAR